jgi:hypothetical protein
MPKENYICIKTVEGAIVRKFLEKNLKRRVRYVPVRFQTVNAPMDEQDEHSSEPLAEQVEPIKKTRKHTKRHQFALYIEAAQTPPVLPHTNQEFKMLDALLLKEHEEAMRLQKERAEQWAQRSLTEGVNDLLSGEKLIMNQTARAAMNTAIPPENSTVDEYMDSEMTYLTKSGLRTSTARRRKGRSRFSGQQEINQTHQKLTSSNKPNILPLARASRPQKMPRHEWRSQAADK